MYQQINTHEGDIVKLLGHPKVHTTKSTWKQIDGPELLGYGENVCEYDPPLQRGWFGMDNQQPSSKGFQRNPMNAVQRADVNGS